MTDVVWIDDIVVVDRHRQDLGAIPHRRVGRRIFFSRDDLARIVDGSYCEPEPNVTRRGRRPSTEVAS